jgi:uncharacterized membrane protein
MKNKQEFFKKLKSKAGDHPLKERLVEDLQDHIEDAEEFRRQHIDQTIVRLGKPTRIARDLREINFSFKRLFSYILAHFIVLTLFSLPVYYVVFGKFSISLFDLLSPFFIIVVSPIIAVIFTFPWKKFTGYSEKEAVVYGASAEITKATLALFLMVFTHLEQFTVLNDPDVRPDIPQMILFRVILGAIFSWIGGVIGSNFKKNSSTKNPPMVGV